MTSRNSAWQGIADPVPVDLLPLGSAVELLRRTGDLDEAGSRPAGRRHWTDCRWRWSRPLPTLPGGCGWRYLELFKERHAELLALGRRLPIRAPWTPPLPSPWINSGRPIRQPASCWSYVRCWRPTKSRCRYCSASHACYLSRSPLPWRIGCGRGSGRIAVPPRAAHRGRYRDRPDSSRLVQAVTLAHLPRADRRHQRTVEAVQLLAELFLQARIRTSGRGLPSCSLTLRPCLTTPEPYS